MNGTEGLSLCFQDQERAWVFRNAQQSTLSMFLITDVSNRHEFSSLKQHNFSFFCSSGGHKSKMGWQGCVLSGSSRGKSIFLPFAAVVLACGPFLHLQSVAFSNLSNALSL